MLRHAVHRQSLRISSSAISSLSGTRSAAQGGGDRTWFDASAAAAGASHSAGGPPRCCSRRMMTTTAMINQVDDGEKGASSISRRFQSSSSSNSNNNSTLKDSYDNILVDTSTAPGVAILQLNRPKQFNALSDAVLDDLIHATHVIQNFRDDIGCLVLCSTTPKAFAAGADISEMSDRGYEYCYRTDMFANWQQVTSNGPKPVLAAVSGFCLGGGCELAMQCDVAYASANAKFGQPEINLGILPGAGGTQRFSKAAGKAKAMHYCLTGEFLDAHQAEKAGLVAKVYETHEEMMEDVLHNIASTIANKKGRLAVQAVKEAVNASFELPLEQGLRLERRLFHGLFATRDQKEGMDAFLNKRDPEFVKYNQEGGKDEK